MTTGGLSVTRGGLSPAKITNTATNEEVKFMFNPKEYTLSKSNSWDKKAVKGLDTQAIIFQYGGAMQLSLTLYFDSLDDGTDVRSFTRPLWKMARIDAANTNQYSEKGEPPPILFEWNQLNFKAVIERITEKLTLFTPNGVPVRSQVDISLIEYSAEAVAAYSSQQQSTTAVAGDRMDHIASTTTGSAGNMRSVAESSNINNPLLVRPGTSF